jgi:hypothetical protein
MVGSHEFHHLVSPGPHPLPVLTAPAISAELPAARSQREWLDALLQDSRMSEDEGFDAPFAGEAHCQPA